ncbi:unannotated protein [freshwater metagenome]
MPRTPAGKHGYLDAMTPDQLFDSLAVRLNADAVGGVQMAVNITFTDLGEDWVLGLEHRALHAVRGRHDPTAALTLAMPKIVLYRIIEGTVPFVEAMSEAAADGRVHAEGDIRAAAAIFANLDTFLSNFPLVEP